MHAFLGVGLLLCVGIEPREGNEGLVSAGLAAKASQLLPLGQKKILDLGVAGTSRCWN